MRGDELRQWPVLSSTILGAGNVSAFLEEEVETPSGEVMRRQYLTHPGAVAIVAWREASDDIAVLRQYRHPVRAELVEVPAGLLDHDDEEWLDAAKRELAEEVELQAEQWDILVDMCTSPGGCAESLRIYLARQLSPVQRPTGFILEAEEAHMTWQWVPRSKLVEAILAGQCQSPTLVSGVLALEVALASGRLGRLRPPEAEWPIRHGRAR